MGTHALRPADPRHANRKDWGPLLIVAPALLGVLVTVGGLFVILTSWTPVNWAVIIIGAGAVGVSWRSSHYPTRAARIVLYLAGWVVLAGALRLGAYFQDLTLGGVCSVATAAAVGLMRALERAAGPRDSRSGAA